MTNNKNWRLDADDLTDDMIQELRAEAGSVGDTEMVAVCDRALRGDDSARAECLDVINEARAMSVDDAGASE